MGPQALLPIRRKVYRGFLSALNIHRLGWIRTRDLWVQWQAHYTTKATCSSHTKQNIKYCSFRNTNNVSDQFYFHMTFTLLSSNQRRK
jgi:hypothetical protein